MEALLHISPKNMSHVTCVYQALSLEVKIRHSWNFPGDSLAKTLCSLCGGPGSIPGQGTRSCMLQLKNISMLLLPLKILRVQLRPVQPHKQILKKIQNLPRKPSVRNFGSFEHELPVLSCFLKYIFPCSLLCFYLSVLSACWTHE